MRIVIGRGNHRHTFDVPAGPSRVIGKDGKTERFSTKAMKAERDKIAEQIKNFLFRPALLNQ